MLISGDDTRFGTHPAWMEIDAQALRHNLKQIRKRATSNVMVIGSVKANGYGHGVLPICKIIFPSFLNKFISSNLILQITLENFLCGSNSIISFSITALILVLAIKL